MANTDNITETKEQVIDTMVDHLLWLSCRRDVLLNELDSIEEKMDLLNVELVDLYYNDPTLE